MSQTGNPDGFKYSGQGDTSGQAYVLGTDVAPNGVGSSFYFVSYS